MYQNRTLVVVGAGASHEFNLPTGDALKAKIASALEFKFHPSGEVTGGDPTIWHALQFAAQQSALRATPKLLANAASWVRDAVPLAVSIDHCLHSLRGHPLVEKCGKLAIVSTILSGERSSKLYVDPTSAKQNIPFGKISDAWCVPFMQLLTQDCTRDQIAERFASLTLVIFNYDRCVEQFLFHGLMQFYRMSESDAATCLKALTIFHPYGSVGELPWQGGSTPVPFGEEIGAQHMLALTSQIKTFTEGADPDASQIKQIRKAVLDADTVLFLGFRYYALNMDLIIPDARKKRDRTPRIYGTAVGMSKSDIKEVEADLANLFLVMNSSDVALRSDLKCHAIFGEYSRSLALG